MCPTATDRRYEVTRDYLRLVPAVVTLALFVGPSTLLSQSSKFDEFTVADPLVGDVAPDFTLQTLDGETFTLSEAYAIQPVVIEFGSYT